MALFKEGNNRYRHDEDAVIINIPPEQSIRFIRYMTTSNDFCTEKNKKNLEKLLNMIDIDLSYEESDISGRNYFLFLKEYTHIMNAKFISDEDSLRTYFVNEFSDKTIPGIIVEECLNIVYQALYELDEFTEPEILAMNKYVEEKIQYSYLFKNASKIIELFGRVKLGNERTKVLNTEAERIISSINREMKAVKTDSQLEFNNLDFSDKDNALNVIDRQINSLRKPSNKLKTGHKMLNTMLNGGFEGGRTYLFFGPPKSFKSGTLLNMALTAARNNNDIKTKENRIPVIVYLTMENDIKETFDRMYEYSTGMDISQSNHTSEEVFDIIHRTINNDGLTNIEVKVYYAPSKTKNTEFLDEICDDLKEQGKEVIMMVQDYIGRISSATIPNSDIRLELGAVSDEFSNFAKEKNIPLISAGQLNRSATERKEDCERRGINDIASTLTISQIAESVQIQQNIDYAIINCRETLTYMMNGEEYSEDYLGLKLVAARGKEKQGINGDKVRYLGIPFENGFKLKEDEGTKFNYCVPSISKAKMTDDQMREFDQKVEKTNTNKEFRSTSTSLPTLSNAGTLNPTALFSARRSENRKAMEMLENDPSNDFDF